MAANPFLVTYIYPAHKEQNVSIDTTVKVRFQADMKTASLHEGTVYITKINGSKVTCTYEYKRETKELWMKPAAPLEPLAQYELTIIGTVDGVKTITGDIIGVDKVYNFATKGDVSVSEPLSFTSKVEHPAISFSWLTPVSYQPTEQIIYHFCITRVNETPSDTNVIWPVQDKFYPVTQLSLSIPTSLPEGSYTAHIRATQKDIQSKWVSASFLIEKKEEPKEPTLEPGLRIVESYPKDKAIFVKEKEILIAFSEKLEESSVSQDSVYLVEEKPKESYTQMDLYTRYSKDKAVSGTVVTVEEGRLIKIAFPEEMLDNKMYTVILRSSIASQGGLSLGVTHSLSFSTPYNPFYGNMDDIRMDVSSFIQFLPDEVLAKYIYDVSREAFQIASKSKAYDEAQYKDGKYPYEVGEYVRHKVAYQLLLDTFTSIGTGGKEAIKLGDLQVEGKTSVGDAMTLMRYFKEAMKPWLDWIQGHHNRGYAKPTNASRGRTGNPMPPFIDRVTLKQME